MNYITIADIEDKGLYLSRSFYTYNFTERSTRVKQSRRSGSLVSVFHTDDMIEQCRNKLVSLRRLRRLNKFPNQTRANITKILRLLRVLRQLQAE